MEVGDPMPDATLIGAQGPMQLRDKIGAPLVVYFYPRDDTIGCTIQACGFRDRYAAFQSAGAEVIGISRDSLVAHDRFKESYALPFELLSDPDGAVATGWGVKSYLGLLGRVTFVFDRSGILRLRFESRIRLSKHVDDALKMVRTL